MLFSIERENIMDSIFILDQDTNIKSNEIHEHSNPFDVSLFEDNAKIKRIPLYAYDEDEYGVGNQVKLERYSGLYNESLNKVLQSRPIADTYKLVPHQDLFSLQAHILDKTDLPKTNVRVVDKLINGGLQAQRTIYYDDLAVPVSNSRDIVKARIDIFNSVDTSWAFQVFSGAYRNLCRNTLVFGGEKSYHQKKKHTLNLNPSATVQKAGLGLCMWSHQKDLMLNWRGIQITDQQFADMLKETICTKKTKSAEVGVNPVNETKLNYLLGLFEEEKKELGSTLWGAYNALTHWSTHTDYKVERYNPETHKLETINCGRTNANKPNVERQRADVVRDLLTSDAWQSLEMASA